MISTSRTSSRTTTIHIPSISVLLFSLSIKLLLFPAAHSTDFEVHRHWKALTYSLPLSHWYTDTSSQWTLDYPPLFAYLEYVLSHIAAVFHPPLLSLSAHNYVHPSAKLFLRSTVLLTDPLLFYAAHRYTTAISPHSSTPSAFAIALILLSPHLTLVDNIHFQYNAIPLSLLLISLSYLAQNSPLPAALFFSLALNIKHTLIPLAPPIALHILLSISRTAPSNMAAFKTLLSVTGGTLFVFTILWAPFFLVGGPSLLRQILHRLFPFSRGLLHAYWAPNFWALYAATDKVLHAFGLSLRDVDVNPASGHIGAFAPFALLPNPTPLVCATLVAMLSVHAAFASGGVTGRTGALVGCVVAAVCAFEFGWHVHEKAVLVGLIPLAGLVGVKGGEMLREAFLWMSIGSGVGLFPLVEGLGESLFKVVHYVAYHILAIGMLLDGRRLWGWRGYLVVAYVMGGVFLEGYAGAGGGHRWVFGRRLEFLPLMLVSVYSGVGIMIAFGMLLLMLMFDAETLQAGER